MCLFVAEMLQLVRLPYGVVHAPSRRQVEFEVRLTVPPSILRMLEPDPYAGWSLVIRDIENIGQPDPVQADLLNSLCEYLDAEGWNIGPEGRFYPADDRAAGNQSGPLGSLLWRVPCARHFQRPRHGI